MNIKRKLRLKKNKKRLLLFSILLILVLVTSYAILSTSYAIWNLVLVQKNPNIVKIGDFKSRGMLRKINTYWQEDVWHYDTEGMWQHKDKITKIIIQNQLSNIENAIYSYDESVLKDKSVMSYIIQNEDNTTYTAYLQSDNVLYLNPNSQGVFSWFTILENIEGMEYINTEYSVKMNQLFAGSSKLKSVDVSNFDTSNVQDMQSMFNGLSNITELNVSSFNTRNVRLMNNMFNGCSSLTTLDITSFDTSNVTNMTYMFAECSALTNLDVSHFNTSKVTNMNGIFRGAKSLTSLDVSGFDTSNVTDFSNMFNETPKLTNIIYDSSFVYANDADITYMFANCPANKPSHSSWNGMFQ